MTYDADHSLDITLCPLCGGPNQCAMAANPSATECWCSEEKFPRGLLAQIPENAVRRTCVCPDCLMSYRENQGNSMGEM